MALKLKTMITGSIASLAAASALLTAPVSAQAIGQATAQAKDDGALSRTGSPEIVVEGETQKEVREQLWESLETTEGYITSFDASMFCPGVAGFDPQMSEFIVERIRANVIAAGYEIPDKPCKPTAIVIFSDDPQGIVEGLRKKRPGLFLSNFTAEIRSLTGVERPYYAWKVVEERTVDGIPIRDGENRQAQATRLSANVRYDIIGSYLVVDRKKTPGMTLSQIADFATLHLLVEFDRRVAEKSPPSSILKLFNIDDPTLLPDTMSRQDMAMIKGLADDDLVRMNAGRQRNRLASTIVRELEKSEAPTSDAAESGG